MQQKYHKERKSYFFAAYFWTHVKMIENLKSTFIKLNILLYTKDIVNVLKYYPSPPYKK